MVQREDILCPLPAQAVKVGAHHRVGLLVAGLFIYHVLGYDKDTEVTDPSGRPLRIVAGTPVYALL